jgi:hypothetical protein
MAESLANSSKQFMDGFNFDKRANGILPMPFSFTKSTPAQGPSVPPPAPPPVVKQEPVDEDWLLQRFQSMLNEKFHEYDTKNERFFDDMKNTKDKMDIMLKNPHNFGLTQPGCPQRPPPMMNSTSRAPGCFYCNQPGHFLNECLAREAHLQAGKIQSRPDGIFTSDGRRLAPNPRESMREFVDKYVSGAAQNVQGVYDDEYSRQQYNYNYVPEPDSALREEIRQLHAAIETIKQSPSSRAPLPPQTQQYVQHQSESDTGLNQVRREQERMSRVLSQMAESLDDLKNSRTQLVATQMGSNTFNEDFQED